MRGLLLDPVGFHARARQRVDFLQIENLPSQQPRGRMFSERGAGEYLKLPFARAEVLTAFVLSPDLRRPAGKQATVDGFVFNALFPNSSFVGTEGWLGSKLLR